MILSPTPESRSNGQRPVALVTGAGSGIGRAIAVQLSAHGYSCILAGRSTPRLEETASLLDTPSCIIGIDLTELDQIPSLVDQSIAFRGRIDAIVNNAGWSAPATIAQTDEALLTSVFKLNAMAPALIIAKFWPFLVKQANNVTGAPRVSIVNISSLAVRDPFPQLYAYAAAKASVHLLATSASREGKPHGIRAFVIAPGAVETQLLRSIVDSAALPPSLALHPDEVASMAGACIAGERDDDNGGVIWMTKSPLVEV